jgi:FKBP-type peptidyl-prolyl cis-trans isomerase FklB
MIPDHMNLKSKLPIFAAIGLLATNIQAQENPPGEAPLKDDREKLSYSLGVNIGTVWKQRGVEADPDVVARGIRDALSGQPLLTEQETREITSAYQKELNAKAEQRRKEQGEKNKAEGEAFLAKNQNEPGVISMPSGLQYKVLTEGTGPKPQSTNRVSVHYRGTLLDGTEFDSSYKRGKPAVFPVTGVIKGWQEALQLMPVGSKWQLFIPSHLAYGERGAGSNIAPNAALIFEVELLSIEEPPAAAAVPAAPSRPITSDIIKVPSAEDLKKGAKIEILKPEDVERIRKEQEEAKKKEQGQQEAEKKE